MRLPRLKKAKHKTAGKSNRSLGRLLMAVLVVLVPTSLALFFDRLVVIRQVNCKNQYGDCVTAFTQKLTELEGQKYSSAKKMLNAIVVQDAAVTNYRAKLVLPDKLLVYVIEEKPRYALQNNTGDVVFILDKSGVVLRQEQSSNLPKLTTERVYDQGETVDSKTFFSLELLAGLSSYYNIKSASLEGEDLVVEVVDGPKAIFPSEGDYQLLLGGFNLVYQRLRNASEDSRIEKSAEVREIDMRFKNPIVRL